jgi:hypothetical protein
VSQKHFSLFAALLIVGCSFPSTATRRRATDSSSGRRLTEARVLEIANRAAARHGFRVSDYQPPKVHYQFTRRDNTWTVFYELKPPTPPGGHFLVWVNDRSEAAQVMPGE